MKKLSAIALGTVISFLALSISASALVTPSTIQETKDNSQIVQLESSENTLTIRDGRNSHMGNRKRNIPSSETSRESYMKSRQERYEAQIDKDVADGILTKKEADEYKANFDKMAEYCNRARDNGYGYGNGGCH